MRTCVRECIQGVKGSKKGPKKGSSVPVATKLSPVADTVHGQGEESWGGKG